MGKSLILQYLWILLASSVMCEFQLKTSAFDFFNPIRLVTPRIVNGIEATATQGQYQVSLRISAYEDISYGAGFFCGGTLISDRAILTAAHCTYLSQIPVCPSQIHAVIGGLNLLTPSNNTLRRELSTIIRHEKYDPNMLENDIAILKLKQPLELPLLNIVPIDIATNKVAEGTQCQVTGWGLTSYDSSDGPTENLMITSLTLLSADYCNNDEHYGSTYYVVRNGMICASAEAVGSCGGDSGGPFVCENQLAGLVSWGLGCAFSMYPDVFTDVYYYKDWIAENSGYQHKLFKMFNLWKLICFFALYALYTLNNIFN